MSYRYVLDDDVAEDIFTLSSRQREQFIIIFRALSQDPFQAGEQTFKDSTGRDIYKKKFGKWQVSFWSDHAVKEVRVVGIQALKK